LIAATKESFYLFASDSCGLRTVRFLHFYGSQAAFVATAICAKWVPVSGCQCREEEERRGDEEKSEGLRAECGV